MAFLLTPLAQALGGGALAQALAAVSLTVTGVQGPKPGVKAGHDYASCFE